MIIPRSLNLFSLLKKSSWFLWGPRATGKSTLIKHQLLKGRFKNNITYINLLDSKLYLRLKSNPSFLEDLSTTKYIVIDEVQRIPELLNEVHRLIEDYKKRFLLTGSSARKLKRNNTNLLAGRALKIHLFPLTWRDLSQSRKFKLNTYLQFGGLPLSYLKPTRQHYLYSYVDTYLKEEIQAEALVRSLPNYTRFLQSAALNNAQMLNYTKVARDGQLSPNTVRDYYQILEDTLLGFQVLPYTKSKKRKAIETAKFYFFDTGVTHTLMEVRHLDPKSDLFGRAFEQFIACELRAYLAYNFSHTPLQFWKSKSGREVDFIIGNSAAIEVKATTKVTQDNLKGLLALQEEKKFKHLVVVSRDPIETRSKTGIRCFYWENFLTRLWNHRFISI